MTIEASDWEVIVKALVRENETLTRSLTTANLKVLGLVTELEVMSDQLENAIARAQGKGHNLSQNLRHEATQSSVVMLHAANVLNQGRNRALAASLTNRSAKLVDALKCSKATP